MVLMMAVTSTTSAAGSDQCQVTICIRNNATGGKSVSLVRCGSDKEELQSNDTSTFAFRRKSREAVQISACDFNPTLFTYADKAGDKTENPDYTAVKKFAEAIQAAGKVLGQDSKDVSDKAISPPLIISAVNLAGLMSRSGPRAKQLSDLLQPKSQAADSVGSALDVARSGKAAAIEDMKVQVSGWAKIATDFNKDLDSLDALEAVVAVPGNIPVSGPLDLVTLGPFTSLSEVCEKARKGRKSHPPLKDATAICQQAEWLQSAFVFKQHYRSVTKLLIDFASLYKDTAVGPSEWHPLVASIPYDATSTTPHKITIGRNETFKAYFSDDTKTYVSDSKRVGDVTVNIGAQSDWHVAIAPGVIYSFVRTQKFSPMSSSGGGLVVAATTSDYAALSGLVALNISRDSSVGQGVQPFYQVGIAPDSKNLGFVLGGGLKLFDFVISAGAVYQKTDTLATGLTVGGPLKSTDALKTDSTFRAGVYIGLSYNAIGSNKK